LSTQFFDERIISHWEDVASKKQGHFLRIFLEKDDFQRFDTSAAKLPILLLCLHGQKG
jgi:hypothetical protein